MPMVHMSNRGSRSMDSSNGVAHHRHHNNTNNNTNNTYNNVQNTAVLPVSMPSRAAGGRTSASPIVGATTPSPKMDDVQLNKKTANFRRTIDEMRAHIAKLKGELEAEKVRSRQLHRDKVSEVRQAKADSREQREAALQQLAYQLGVASDMELSRQREQLLKDRDAEIRTVLRQSEEELRTVRAKFNHEKDSSIKVALEMQKRMLLSEQHQQLRDSCLSPSALSDSSTSTTNTAGIIISNGGSGNSALIVRLQREIKQLKAGKKDLEEQLNAKTAEDNEEIADMRCEHRVVETRLSQESRQERMKMKDMQFLRSAEEDQVAANERRSSGASGRLSALSWVSSVSGVMQDGYGEQLASTGSSRRGPRDFTSASNSITPVSVSCQESVEGTDTEEENVTSESNPDEEKL